MDRSTTLLILPFTRLELPGWGWIAHRVGKIGYEHDDLWANSARKTIRGKWHGYQMSLDMTNWSSRLTYVLGRYYELHTQLLLNEILKPGDRVIDIGANIGMVTLHAAHLVGPSGQIECFEPNPQCQQEITNALTSNTINHVELNPFGLSDAPAQLELKLNHTHSGIGTFAEMNPDEVVSSTTAEVKRGDDVFDSHSKAPRVIKIDVEGFEYRALLGMKETLKAWKSMVFMEMNQKHLQRAGTSIQEVSALMKSLGYRASDVRVKKGLIRYHLDLVPVKSDADFASCRDVLWTHQDAD